MSQLFESWPSFYIERIVSLMKMIVFNLIQVINYWFTLHCVLRFLYQQAQTSSPYIQGISDQDITLCCQSKCLLLQYTSVFVLAFIFDVVKSFSFWLARSTALCIVIWQSFMSWLSTYSVDDEELCIWHWRHCLISFIWCSSSTISWGVSAVQADWVCECSCSKDIWY